MKANYHLLHIDLVDTMRILRKDLINLTQEKIIQAIGRVGRNKQCKDYSIRMRDNIFIDKIFKRKKYSVFRNLFRDAGRCNRVL